METFVRCFPLVSTVADNQTEITWQRCHGIDHSSERVEFEMPEIAPFSLLWRNSADPAQTEIFPKIRPSSPTSLQSELSRRRKRK